MARMSTEFKLVLVGASILTAGYFLMPSDDEEQLKQKVDNAAQQQVAGNRSSHHSFPHFFYIHTGGYYAPSGTARTPIANVSKGGFGSYGRSFSGIS